MSTADKSFVAGSNEQDLRPSSRENDNYISSVNTHNDVVTHYSVGILFEGLFLPSSFTMNRP